LQVCGDVIIFVSDMSHYLSLFSVIFLGHLLSLSVSSARATLSKLLPLQSRDVMRCFRLVFLCLSVSVSVNVSRVSQKVVDGLHEHLMQSLHCFSNSYLDVEDFSCTWHFWLFCHDLRRNCGKHQNDTGIICRSCGVSVV